MEYQLRYHLWPIIVRKQLNFQIYKQKISSKKIVRNINWESFIYSEVRIRYCDIFDYNCKISNTWYCFLHICSWGIHYFYIDKLQPTSLVYHSSQLFSNWILNSPPWILEPHDSFWGGASCNNEFPHTHPDW